MGCGGSGSRVKKLVQIDVPVRLRSAKAKQPAQEKAATPQREIKTRLVPVVETFHCGECLLTLPNRTTDYHHRCRGYDPATADDPRREYQRQRLAKCEQCQHNLDGVCEIEKQAHPDRPCLIERGVRILAARCRIGEWDGIG